MCLRGAPREQRSRVAFIVIGVFVCGCTCVCARNYWGWAYSRVLFCVGELCLLHRFESSSCCGRCSKTFAAAAIHSSIKRKRLWGFALVAGAGRTRRGSSRIQSGFLARLPSGRTSPLEAALILEPNLDLWWVSWS